jgi:hypothetical protein
LVDVALVSRSPWRFAAYPGEMIVTPHYRIYTTLEYDGVVDELPVFLEHALTQYRTALADLPAPKQPMETYLFHDRRQWAAKTRQLLPDYAATFDNLGRGGYATGGTAVLYYIDYRKVPRDTFAIAAHEGWHQYTQSTFTHPLPIWLEEGIATYMEGIRQINGGFVFQPRRNHERLSALREAVRYDRLIPLDELLDEPPQTFLKQDKRRLLTYYAQVWALAQYLMYGEAGRYQPPLRQVLHDAADGQLLPRLTRSPVVLAQGGRAKVLTSRVGAWVILGYFTNDLVDFELGYLDFVHELCGTTRDDLHHRRR